MENGAPRLVRTPWFDEDIPFEEAAEIGTRKVITDHSTIGIVMLTDGSITDIPRESYMGAEERVIEEMKKTGKPFVIAINSTDPTSALAEAVRDEVEEKYGVSAVILNALQMSAADACALLEGVLMEFPLSLFELRLPGYIMALPKDSEYLSRLIEPLNEVKGRISKVRDYGLIVDALRDIEDFSSPIIERIDLGSGRASIRLQPDEGIFYKVLSDACGYDISDDYELIRSLREFVSAKREFDRISGALSSAKSLGYAMVPPLMDEMELSTPEIVQQGGRFGVKLKAKASGLQMFRVDLESEVNPIVGSEQQSEALVEHLMSTFENDPEAIWQTNIFGKPLYDLVRDGMSGKVNRMPDNVQERLRGTLERIANDGCNSLICIML